MDLPRDSTMQYVTGAALVGMLIAFVLFLPDSLTQWLRKKNYQYEVTFSLYMLTPTEKFVFSTSTLPLSILLPALPHPSGSTHPTTPR